MNPLFKYLTWDMKYKQLVGFPKNPDRLRLNNMSILLRILFNRN